MIKKTYYFLRNTEISSREIIDKISEKTDKVLEDNTKNLMNNLNNL